MNWFTYTLGYLKNFLDGITPYWQIFLGLIIIALILIILFGKKKIDFGYLATS